VKFWCWPTAQRPPDWVAMDLFSQAEHDELAQSILLCPDKAYIDRGAGQHQPPAA
jgi:histidinol dehydrogenase